MDTTWLNAYAQWRLFAEMIGGALGLVALIGFGIWTWLDARATRRERRAARHRRTHG